MTRKVLIRVQNPHSDTTYLVLDMIGSVTLLSQTLGVGTKSLSLPYPHKLK